MIGQQQIPPGAPLRVPSSRRISAPLLVLLLLGALGIAWFLATDAAVYLSYGVEKYTEYYWPRRAGLILHISAGVVALTIGLVQVWLGLTARTGALHRILGNVYLVAVLLGVCASFYMAATIPPGGWVYQSGLVGLGCAWLITTAAAYRFIRRGDVRRHRAWAIRSYVVTFGFVSLRLIVAIIAGLGLMTEDAANSPAAWLCWVVPLASIEVAYRRWGRLHGL